MYWNISIVKRFKSMTLEHWVFGHCLFLQLIGKITWTSLMWVPVFNVPFMCTHWLTKYPVCNFTRLLQWIIDEDIPVELRTESAIVLGSLAKGTAENINCLVDSGCVAVLLKGTETYFYFSIVRNSVHCKLYTFPHVLTLGFRGHVIKSNA